MFDYYITTSLVLGLLFMTVMSYFIYKSKAIVLIKMLGLPSLLALIGYVSFYIYYETGRPIETYPKGSEWELVHFKITNDTKYIVMYVTDDRGERLYQIPYDRDMVKKMQEAMDQQKENKGSRIKGKTELKGQNGQQSFSFEVGKPKDSFPTTK